MALRTLFIAALAALASGAVAAAPASPPARDDMSLGNPKAKVTVVEYASVGCPHCATWGINVFPEFKKAYIDTGKARFVYREMLTGNSTLAAAGFLTARCAGPTKYFQVVDGVYRAQAEIAQTGDGYAPLVKIAKDAGLTEDQFNACLKDPAQIAALEARDKRAEADGVTGTPTFKVNGKTVEGEVSLEALGAAIARAPRK
jgi:protein-disulfide isomerase